MKSPLWKETTEVCNAKEVKNDLVHFLNNGTYYMKKSYLLYIYIFKKM